MTDAPWKNFERQVASSFGVKRRLQKGTGEVADIGGEDFPLLVDAKLRKGFRPHEWMRKLRQVAIDEGLGRPAILVTRHPPHLRRYALCDESWLLPILIKAATDHLFSLSRFHGKKWSVEDWWKKASIVADDKNAIPLLVIGSPGEPNTAVLELHVLTSLLKSAGIIWKAAKLVE